MRNVMLAVVSAIALFGSCRQPETQPSAPKVAALRAVASTSASDGLRPEAASLLRRMRNQLGPVTMHVSPGRIVMRDGRVITTNWYNQPLTNALAYALRLAEPGEVIGLSGEHPAVRIGGPNVSKIQEAARADGAPIPRCAIVRDDDADRPSIFGVSIAGTANPESRGIEGLTFFDVEFVCDSLHSAKTPFLVEQNIQTGYVRLWGCEWTRSTKSNAWSSTYGMMWGTRFHGSALFVEIVGCKSGDASEHSLFYGDNLGRAGDRTWIAYNVVTGRGGGRTCVQFANRPQSGPSSGGTILVEHNDLRCIDGGGGGAITVAGHQGKVVLRDNRIFLHGGHNGVQIWIDTGHGGLITNDDGFATNEVVIDGIDVEGGDRPHVAVSAAQRVVIRNGFRLKRGQGETSEICFDFGHDGTPRIQNGSIEFVGIDGQLSAYAGFQSGVKVAIDGRALTNAEIDALQK